MIDKSSPEYICWRRMIDRCTNPKSKQWAYYGGRGISVARWWLRFEHFIADVGPRPSPSHSLDRYPDNNGDYRPGNTRWATRDQQQANTRKTRYVIFNGKRVPFCTAYQVLGISKNAALGRIKLGWTAQQAIDRPLRRKKSIPAKIRAKIRAATGSQDAIAARFGVAQSSVSSIKLGKWK